MAIKSETYYYRPRLTYVDIDNNEIEIDTDQLQYIIVDKDYDNNNMPVVSIYGSIEKNILDSMIKYQNDTVINFGLYKYDSTNQRNTITDKYFNDSFIFIIPDDVNKTADLDYGANSKTDGTTTNTLYRDIIIWLLPQSAVNNNSQTINGIYKNASMNSLILQSSNYLGKMLLEPISYDTKFDQVVIPPLDSISTYIKYLNNNLGVFYDTSYRFFIDFDCTYITSSSGNVTRMRGQDIFTIVINILKVDNTTTEDTTGASVDLKTGKYTIDINSSKMTYTKNYVTNKMVNKVTVIDSEGNVNTNEIDDNDIKSTTTINSIYNVSNTDSNAISNISNGIEQNNVNIVIVINDLDAGIFTMNKEYIINDYEHEEYGKRYILSSVKQQYIKQSDDFIMTTVLSFKLAK